MQAFTPLFPATTQPSAPARAAALESLSDRMLAREAARKSRAKAAQIAWERELDLLRTVLPPPPIHPAPHPAAEEPPLPAPPLTAAELQLEMERMERYQQRMARFGVCVPDEVVEGLAAAFEGVAAEAVESEGGRVVSAESVPESVEKGVEEGVEEGVLVAAEKEDELPIIVAPADKPEVEMPVVAAGGVEGGMGAVVPAVGASVDDLEVGSKVEAAEKVVVGVERPSLIDALARLFRRFMDDMNGRSGESDNDGNSKLGATASVMMSLGSREQ